MKANELMIGDWVYGLYPDGSRYAKPFRISAVDIYPLNKSPRIVTFGGYGFQEEHLAPIPIAPEILEKNGFTNGEFYAESHIEDWQIMSDGSHLAARSERGWCIDIPCRYVHQLQHALRLCGIEKEIEIEL